MLFASGTVTGTADYTLVTGVAGKMYKVLGAVITSKTEVDANLKSGSTTVLCPIYSTSARGGAVLPLDKEGWVLTEAGEGLVFSQNMTGTTGVLVRYAVIG